MASSKDHGKPRRYINLLQEFSIPLLLGVVVALVVANVNEKLYDQIVHHTYSFFVEVPATSHDATHSAVESHGSGDHGSEDHGSEDHGSEDHGSEDHGSEDHSTDGHGSQANPSKDRSPHGPPWTHYATLHFFINDIFMVFFFGIAAKEITESCLPGGALNPPSKAINPLLGTIGGVVGPVATYLLLNSTMGQDGWTIGWGIPTATDIALAWLVARMVFGAGHPAISFLLLLAVADDGIGLGIIALAYPDPNHATQWLQTLWILPSMAIAFGLRKFGVKSWLPYVLVAGTLSWWGLYSAHLHPALALVPIVPFMPGPKRDEGLFQEDADSHDDHTLDNFEHDLKFFVDFGLFFFAFANAGVPFSNVNGLTWIVLLSLLIGKTVGITVFSYGGALVGFPLPEGMSLKHLFVAGIVAGLGLTVALFVAGQAFKTQVDFQGAAKMGALFSAGAAIIAIVAGRMLRVSDRGGDQPHKDSD